MAELDPWAPSDPLGEALHLLRVNGAFYCVSELTAPWGLTLPAMPGHLWFHVPTAGAVWVDASEGELTSLRHGELVLVCRGEGHVLRSDPDAAAPGILELERELVSERFEILRHGGGGEPTTLICGAIRFDHPIARHLTGVLPPTIRIEPSGPPHTDWIQSTLALMAAEARGLQPGGEAVLTRLADIVVIQAIRSWIETDPAARQGWLGALRDRQIGPAIALMHRHPERPWSVASLAAEVAMSRSAFAARFTALVGEPAMQYLTRWRMQVAHEALRSEGATVAQLAEQLGYRSEAAFARAFKRMTGVSPGAVRRGAEAKADPGRPPTPDLAYVG